MRCKNLISLLLCALLLTSLALPAAALEDSDLLSEAVIVMDADTGQILYEKNMHEQLYPASITKIMTAYLAMKYLEPDQILTMSQAAYNAVSRESSHISLTPGEELTVEQALYAIGVVSANDAANALAEAVSGSLEEFAELMTAEAAALGAQDTHFANANGLTDSEHYTSAYDMAVITRAAIQIPGLMTYFSTLQYEMPATDRWVARTFNNQNRLITGVVPYEGVLMSKTGWTSAAQGTLVSVVEQNGIRLICVTLKSPRTEDKYIDTTALLDSCFTRYERASVSGELLAANLELQDYFVDAGQSFSFLLTEGSTVNDLTVTVNNPEVLNGSAEQAVLELSFSVSGDESLQLPDGQLTLTRAPEETLPEETEAGADAEDTGDPEAAGDTAAAAVQGIDIRLICAAAAGLLLLLFLAGRLRKKLRRRRESRERVRRLRSRMEDRSQD